MQEWINLILVLTNIALLFVISAFYIKITAVIDKVDLKYKQSKLTDMVIDNKFQNLYS